MKPIPVGQSCCRFQADNDTTCTNERFNDYVSPFQLSGSNFLSFPVFFSCRYKLEHEWHISCNRWTFIWSPARSFQRLQTISSSISCLLQEISCLRPWRRKKNYGQTINRIDNDCRRPPVTPKEKDWKQTSGTSFSFLSSFSIGQLFTWSSCWSTNNPEHSSSTVDQQKTAYY